MDRDLHKGWKSSRSILATGISAAKVATLYYKLKMETFSAEDDGQWKTTKKINKTEMIKKMQH